MSEWQRSTYEIDPDQIPTEIQVVIHTHIDLYNLGDILSTALMCIQTDSEKPKKGLFRSAEFVRQYVMVTSRWLIWSVSGAKTPVTVMSALLKDIVVQDYATTSFAALIPDSGIQVEGKFTDVSESGSTFIGLENNVVGQKFKETVIAIVQEVKK